MSPSFLHSMTNSTKQSKMSCTTCSILNSYLLGHSGIFDSYYSIANHLFNWWNCRVEVTPLVMLPAMQLANNDVQHSSNYYHHPRLPPLPRIHVIQPSVQFDTRYAGRNKIGLGTGDPEPRIYFSQINALFNRLVNNLRPRQSVTVTITNFISRNNN